MKELGIEPMLLIAQIVNFGIIFFILNKFLYKPLITMIDRRKREIEEGMETAKKIQEEEEKTRERHDKLIAEARKESRSIIEEAKKNAEEQKKQVVAEAHKEAAAILEKAKRQAEEKMREAEERIRKQMVDLAASMAEKLIPEVLSDTDHKKLIAERLKDLEKAVRSTN
ncbi:MAG: F0F1 ATP synthase subunit B [Patescibacteria group bacterium]|nr:F0F1 ATP synthase subunit B [Patescibacteria group bacterium]